MQFTGLDFPGVNKNYPQCSTSKIGNYHVFSCIFYSGSFPSINNDALLAGIDFHPSICPSSTTLHPGHPVSSSQGFHIGQATSTCVWDCSWREPRQRVKPQEDSSCCEVIVLTTCPEDGVNIIMYRYNRAYFLLLMRWRFDVIHDPLWLKVNKHRAEGRAQGLYLSCIVTSSYGVWILSKETWTCM